MKNLTKSLAIFSFHQGKKFENHLYLAFFTKITKGNLTQEEPAGKESQTKRKSCSLITKIESGIEQYPPKSLSNKKLSSLFQTSKQISQKKIVTKIY